jgi:hypothetical protein
MSDSLTNDTKTKSSLFEQGGPGGPGRPKGSRSKLARALDDIAAGDAEAVYATVRDMALRGDLQACKEILARTWPVPKGRPLDISPLELNELSDLPKIVASLFSTSSDGDLLPSEARDIAALLETYRKSVEIVELESRLNALERRIVK